MVENGGNIKGGRSDCVSSLHRNSKVQKGWCLLQILSVLWVSAAKQIGERGGVWMTGRCYLDGLKSGRVIVAVLLEHMSCGKTKGAQAVQDGSLEAWAKRILKCGVWNMNEVKTHHLTWIPGRQQSEQRQIWQRGLCPLPCQAESVGGHSPPMAAKLGSMWRGFQSPLRRYRAAWNRRGNKNCLNLYLIYSLGTSYTHRRGIKLNYHEGNKKITKLTPKTRMSLKWHSCRLLHCSRDFLFYSPLLYLIFYFLLHHTLWGLFFFVFFCSTVQKTC